MKQLLSSQVGNEGFASDLPDDPDTEEALKEFDFLVNAEDGEGAGEARSSGDGTEWGKSISLITQILQTQASYSVFSFSSLGLLYIMGYTLAFAAESYTDHLLHQHCS